MRPRRWPLYGLLLLVYLLHNDLWLWNDARLVLGLPIGLTYHVALSVVTALVMFALVKYAWPGELEVSGEEEADEPASPVDDPGEPRYPRTRDGHE